MNGDGIRVDVAWHPDDDPERRLASRLFTTLQGDPTRPGAERLSVPVWFWTTPPGPAPAPPVPIPRAADCAAVLVVVAGASLLSDGPWRTWCANQVAATVRSNGQVVVLAQHDAALGATDVFATLAPVRLADLDAEHAEREAMIAVLAAVADRLRPPGGKRVGVFISHAKRDGAALGEALHRRLEDAKLTTFVDSKRIVPGERFDVELDNALDEDDQCVVMIATDAYASRAWCRYEALRAKRLDLPLVILDAVEAGEVRRFPYAGNAPVIRLRDDREASLDEVVLALLVEVVKARAFTTALLRSGPLPPTSWVCSRPPELASVAFAAQRLDPLRWVIHPDPPLATAERELLQTTFAHVGVRFTTPSSMDRRALQPRGPEVSS